MDKNKLKVGDIIRFHDWGVGGYLFGIIVEYEDDIYHSKQNIWRPKDIYFLQVHGIDNIKLIQSFERLSEHLQRELQEIIKLVQDKNIKMNISLCQ